MADLNKIVRQVEYRSDTSGLDRVSAAADKASAATKKLSDTASTLSTTTEKADKSALNVAAQLDRLSKAADPAQKALAAVERQQRLIDAATKQGQPIRQEWTNALSVLKARHEELTKATAEHTASVGLNRVQLMEASHVAKSFADSLIAGASPLRALSLEGGRIAQIFAEGSGGVGGTLKAMGATVGRLATGWLGLGVAVATGAGLAAAAILRFQSQQDRLTLSLNGAGRYAGVSTSGLTAIANAGGARNPALGQGGATDITAQLAATGRISAAIMPGILDLVSPYARGTGQDLTKAGEELAKAFADPGKGAEELNGKLGFLDDKTKQLIASFERQGDLLGAQQVLLGKAADEAARMTDTTWSLSKAWDGFTSSLGRGANAFASNVHRTFAPTLSDKLADAESAAREYGGLTSDRADENLSNLRLGVAYQEYGNTRAVAGAASDKATNDLSLLVGEAIRKAVPELDKSQELSDTLKLLTDALNNPEALGKVKGGAGAVSLAQGRVQTQYDLSDPLLRIRQDNALAVQAAQADTDAERTLVEARRAELEVLRQTGDATQATAKSLGVWNEEIAKSNRASEDALRQSQQNLDTSLMRPFERGAAQIRFRYEENLRRVVPNRVSALSPSDNDFTALDSFGDLSSAKNAFGGKRGSRISGADDAFLFAYKRSLVPPRYDDHFAVPAAAATAGAAPVGGYAPAAARFAPGNINVASTAAANYTNEYGRNLGAYYNTETLAKLQASNDELDRNAKLLRIRTAMFGEDTAAIQKAVAAQELWNSLALDDEAIRALGPERVAKITSAIKDQTAAQVKLNREQQQYDQFASASNAFQNLGDNVVGNFGSEFGDLFNANPRNLVSQLKTGDQAGYYAGQLSGSAVKQKIFMAKAGDFLRNLAFQQGIGMIQKGLFGSGQYGTPGYQSGLFGGLFNSALGGIGSLFGGGASGGAGGGGLAGVTSLFSSGFAFANGGVMTSAGPLPLRRYAAGGVADSPQLAMYGEGSKPEAFVPLPDGRSIPVAMKGGGGQNISLGGHTIVIQGNADDKTAALMDQKLAAANRQMMADLQRNFGNMQAKWQQRNGS